MRERLAANTDGGTSFERRRSKEDPWSDIGQSVNSSFEFWNGRRGSVMTMMTMMMMTMIKKVPLGGK